MSRRIGRRMRDVAEFVERNPGLPMYAAARYVQPDGRGGTGGQGHSHGYATVHRAIRAGLVSTATRDRRSVLLFPGVAS